MVSLSGMEAAVISRSKLTTASNFTYSVYYLYKNTATTPNTHISASSYAIFGFTIDYQVMQVVALPNNDLVVAVASYTYGLNQYIRLISLTFMPLTKTYIKGVECMLYATESKEIGNFTLTHNGNGRPVIVTTYLNSPGVAINQWDLVSTETYFTWSNKVFDSINRIPMISYLKCWPKSSGKIECFFNTEDITDYIFELTLNLSPFVDPVAQAVKISEIEVPPLFSVVKVDRGSGHVGVLFNRTDNASLWTNQRRRLQTTLTIDLYSACQTLLLVYKPSKSKYVYSGVSCSEYVSYPYVDFALREMGGTDYIYFTALSTNNLLVNSISPATITLLQQIPSPDLLKLSFIGLTGSNSTVVAPLSTTLDQVFGVSPPPPPKPPLWPWILLLLLILLIAGGVYWYFKIYRPSIPPKGEDGKPWYKKTVNEDSELNKNGGITKKRRGGKQQAQAEAPVQTNIEQFLED